MEVEEDLIEVNGLSYPITIFNEKRRGSYAAIRKKGIIIRIPHNISVNEKNKHVNNLKNWIRKRLIKDPIRLEERKYTRGEKIDIFGEKYSLNLVSYEGRPQIIPTGNRLMVLLPNSHSADSEQFRLFFRKWIVSNFLEKVQKRVLELNEVYFKQKINKIALRYSFSRWGSCSSKRNITLSSRLLLAPKEVMDYVIIHEIAHLIERNHSSRFWALVEKIIPDYKEKRKWLRRNGNSCDF